MKKIGIITLYGLFNYGNRLQNYATHRVFQKLGFSVFSFAIKTERDGSVSRITKAKYYFHKLFGFCFTHSEKDWKTRVKRSISFEKFTKQFTPTIYIKDINNLDKKADFFVVGSDQVWNPIWYKGFDEELFLLTFAKPEQRICMAPSFGINNFPSEYKEKFREQLSLFPYLSVREKQGMEIIKQLTGRYSDVVIDPTLMLDREEWLQISRRPLGVNIPQKYVFVYFLGIKSKKVVSDIDRIAIETDYTPLDFLNKDDSELYSLGPQEYIEFISNASLIMTDSFHACVFSFLFDKPFVVYEREGEVPENYSRIDTFLNTFKITTPSIDDFISFRSNKIHDYSIGYNILETEKKKAFLFLEKSLGLI